MKKNIISFLVVMVLLAVALPAMATMYLVKTDETLSQISQHELGTYKRWKEVAKLNHIDDPRKLQAGQWIELPQITINSVEVKKAPAVKILRATAKKRVVTNKEVTKSSAWHPGNNPWKLSTIVGLTGLGLSDDAVINLAGDIANGRIYSWANIRHSGVVKDKKGNEFSMLRMGFGKGIFMDNPQPAWKDVDHAEAMKIYRFHDIFVGFPLICGNPTLLQLVGVAAPSRGPGPGSDITITDTGQGDGGFVYIPPAEGDTKWIIEHEPTIGAWIGGNKVARWEGAYAEYLAWYRTGTHCRMDNGWSLGVGFFGYYSEGDSFLSDYSWREKGWGPQVGIKYLATDWQWQAKVRFLWEDVDGHNDSSGYWMHQDDFKLGLYTEYVNFEHLREDGHYWGITAEIWWMLESSASISSSWSGDQPANRSSMYIGGFWQTKLNDAWQLRLLAGVFHQEWDDLTGVKAAAELRLWETFMFGPSVAFYPFGISDTYDGLALARDLTTITGFARAEAQKVVGDLWCNYERAAVKEEDNAWLEGVMKQLNTEAKF
jgi:hypothetical protein